MKNCIISLLITLIIFSVAIGAALLSIEMDSQDWNDGICPYCQMGNWKFHSAVGHRKSTGYLYICDSCGMVQEFDWFYQQRKD